MKYFLRRSIFFILPGVLFLCILEINLAKSEFSYSVQKNQLEASADSVEVLILGPSYSFTGLNPRLFSHSAFNLSNNNQDIYYDFKLLEKYEPCLKKLKIVVFNIGYQTLDHQLSSGNTEGRKRESFYKRFYDIPRKNSKSYPVDHSFLLNLGFKQGIEHNKNKISRSIVKGWYENVDKIVFSEIEENPVTIVRQKLSAQNEINSDLTNQNIEFLNQAVRLCEKKGIKILLCFDPVTSFYRNNINQLKYNYIVEKLERISDDQDVFFLNLFDDPVFSDSDFSDMHHVNSSGSVKFSLSVNTMVEQILFPGKIHMPI